VRADVIFQTVSDGAVLLATRDEVYYGLNAAGARIWTLLAAEVESLDALCAELGESYPDAPAADLRADAVELLDALRAGGLIEFPGER
jgi:hypothetical protein